MKSLFKYIGDLLEQTAKLIGTIIGSLIALFVMVFTAFNIYSCVWRV